MKTDDDIVLDTPVAIRAFQLLAVKSAIKLESKGIKMGRGRSVKCCWAKHFGMPIRSSHAAVIERLEQEIATLRGPVP